MKDIYSELIHIQQKPIKKRWFRNWYVIEEGSGYGTTYSYCGWRVAAENQLDNNIFGPFWSEQAAKEAATEANNQHYHSVFGGS